MIEATMKTKPENATHWSTRTMARAQGVSQMTVQRIWKAYNLQPHRIEYFKLSTDANFEEKLRDVVGLYLNPPGHAIVLCVWKITSAPWLLVASTLTGFAFSGITMMARIPNSFEA